MVHKVYCLCRHFPRSPSSTSALANVCPAGGEDADRGGDHLRAAVAAPPRPPRLQHRGLPQPDPPADGPLVPHVRQNLHLH